MSEKQVRIAVDAMGGDFAPREIVKGAVEGVRRYGVSIQLVGQPQAIEKELLVIEKESGGTVSVRQLPIEIVEATEIVEMGESPATAIRKKKNASIVVTAKCVAKGESHGMVAAGSTGAAMAAALFNIGRIEGVSRPAIGVTLPTPSSPCLLIDGGANVDCAPEMLNQFAQMGSIFIQNVYDIPKPRVGLLNIGQEPGKGNAFVNNAYTLLEKCAGIHFIGNIEGRDLFAGTVDVAVCDGFTGNVALKSAEGITLLLLKVLKSELKATLPRKIGALLAKDALSSARKKVDPEEYGGALLLGIKGACVIAHGGSSAYAITSAIRVAKEAVCKDVLGKIAGQIQEANAGLSAPPSVL